MQCSRAYLAFWSSDSVWSWQMTRVCARYPELAAVFESESVAKKKRRKTPLLPQQGIWFVFREFLFRMSYSAGIGKLHRSHFVKGEYRPLLYAMLKCCTPHGDALARFTYAKEDILANFMSGNRRCYCCVDVYCINGTHVSWTWPNPASMPRLRVNILFGPIWHKCKDFYRNDWFPPYFAPWLHFIRGHPMEPSLEEHGANQQFIALMSKNSE